MGKEASVTQEQAAAGVRTEQEIASQPDCWRRAAGLAGGRGGTAARAR